MTVDFIYIFILLCFTFSIQDDLIAENPFIFLQHINEREKISKVDSKHCEESSFHTKLTEYNAGWSIQSNILIAHTLSGSIYSVNIRHGTILHTLPRSTFPYVSNFSHNRLGFLPDLSDGSLYVYKKGPHTIPLYKLPFTVPELVMSSPTRSIDDVIYTGRKIDSWLTLDQDDGFITEFQSEHKISSMNCFADKPYKFFIGRSDYTLSMHDLHNDSRRWNVTYSRYMADQLSYHMKQNYTYSHFTSSSNGFMLTIDKFTGRFLWQIELDSPVVSLFVMHKSRMFYAPFTTIAMETLSKFMLNRYITSESLVSTIYVGESSLMGAYAIPSLIDNNDANTQLLSTSLPLIEGPDVLNVSLQTDNQSTAMHNSSDFSQLSKFQHIPKKIYGYHNLSEIQNLQPNYLTANLLVFKNISQMKTDRLSNVLSRAENKLSNIIIEKACLTQDDNSWLCIFVQLVLVYRSVLLISSCLCLGFLFACYILKRHAHPSASSYSIQSRLSSTYSLSDDESSQGVKYVGRIGFDKAKLIGKGCEGTMVYKGWFDGREVAVKRLLNECITLADREVQLLRESDQHSNVIRYFCTEQDAQFCYLALELCVCNLQDYVLNNYAGPSISPLDILRQASAGLHHLHLLNIVHRDIKPHNVLLSVSTGHVHAKISDFGLCRKLSHGRASFSRHSGVAGTDGWIAPEMMDNSLRATCAVDVFSMGCVFYYVKSGGKHPFGESFKRQYNILSGKLCMEDNDILLTSLVSQMVHQLPEERPSMSAILSHPFFWNNEKILRFIQDASDRVDREASCSDLVFSLEKHYWEVVGAQCDWMARVEGSLVGTLRRHRTYKGNSVRSLLRAVRNLRHHRRELCPDVSTLLGLSSVEFLSYWLKRFPRLLVHTWVAFQFVRREPDFLVYYDSTRFIWTLNRDTSIMPSWLLRKQHKQMREVLDIEVDEAGEKTLDTIVESNTIGISFVNSMIASQQILPESDLTVLDSSSEENENKQSSNEIRQRLTNFVHSNLQSIDQH